MKNFENEFDNINREYEEKCEKLLEEIIIKAKEKFKEYEKSKDKNILNDIDDLRMLASEVGSYESITYGGRKFDNECLK